MRSLVQHIFENERTSQTPTQVRAGGGGAADLWLEGSRLVGDESCHHITRLQISQ